MWALLVIIAAALIYWSTYLLINSTYHESYGLGLAQRVLALTLLIGAGFSLIYAAQGLA